MNKKNLDFELNLLPIISVLAVCISFLLLTAVWVQGGSYHLTQALGSEADAKTDESVNLWVEMKDSNMIELSLRQGNKIINRSRSSTSKQSLKQTIAALKAQAPEVTVALVLPAANTDFQQIINVMNELKVNEIKDIGIAPL